MGASGGAAKEPYSGLDDDGDGGYGYDDEDDTNSVNPQEEVQEFETDLRNAFDWNKITFATIPLHQWAWWVAFVFVIMTCFVSGQLIWSHLDNYEKPEVQKYVVRIIFMTPIYAIVALLSLTFDNAAPLAHTFSPLSLSLSHTYTHKHTHTHNQTRTQAHTQTQTTQVMDMMAQKKQMRLPFPLHWAKNSAKSSTYSVFI